MDVRLVDASLDSLGSAFCPADLGRVWHPDRNDFSPCFETAVLSQLPRVFLLVFGIPRLFWLYKQPHPTVPLGFAYYLKLLALVLLAVGAVVDLASSWLSPYYYLPVNAASALSATIFAAVLHHIDHHKSRAPSSILLVYWFAVSVVGAVNIRSLYLDGVYTSDPSRFYILLLSTIVISPALFILELVPKARSFYLTLDDDVHVSPEESANFFSRITFSWMYPLLKQGKQKDLDMDDLWTLRPVDSSQKNSDLFQNAWSAELARTKPSFVRAIVRAYGPTFAIGGVYKVVQDILAFVQPIYLKNLIAFATSYDPEIAKDDPPQPLYHGFLIAVFMLLTAVLQTTVLQQYFHVCFMTGMRVRAAIVTAVYKKSLTLSNTARGRSTVGEIVNLMSVDSAKLQDTTTYLHVIWSGPFQICMALYFLYQTLGPAIFAGVAVMIVMIPVNAYLASISRAVQKVQMKNKDSRTRLMDELLNGIKVIKLYAWERPFMERIQGVREKELSTLKTIGYLSAIQGFTWSCTPFLVSFSSFLVYSFISDEPLTSAKVFVCLSLFNLLQFPLSMFPSVITSLIEASVSFDRLHRFLTNPELDPAAVIRDSSHPDSSPLAIERVRIIDGTFSWNVSGTPTLRNVGFACADGTVTAVVGRVGSGKSSLVQALLGEMERVKGEVHVRGSTAYVPQTAWIMNATLRDNVLFGRRFDPLFYDETISACGLKPDLEILPGGDLTEIGERGITLSGGQKQRISLARAVYSRADIYLLDDPLSAVDAHVGKHIWDKVLGPRGLLKNKCRILVTHALHFLPETDWVIELEEGSICAMGKYDDIKDTAACLRDLMREFNGKVRDKNESVVGVEDAAAALANIALSDSEKVKKDGDGAGADAAGGFATAASEKGKTMTKEESQKGSVDLAVYWAYIQSCGLGNVVFYLLVTIVGQSFAVYQNVYLANWSRSNDRGSEETKGEVLKRLGIYGLIGLAFSASVIFQTLFVWVYCAIRSARQLHSAMLDNVMHAPQRLFDTTPMGRIMNRFSKDQYTVDEVLPRTFQQYIRQVFVVLAVVAVNAIASPLFLLFVAPLVFLYGYFQQFYLATSRELKRLDSTSRSPVYSHFQETLNGVATIRAFNQTGRFVHSNEDKLDYNLKAYYPSVSSNRWLAVRLELIGSMIVFGSALFTPLSIILYGSISPSIVGLMLTYSLSVTQSLNWLVRQGSEISTNMISVERIKEYTDLENEAPYDLPDVAGPNWPQNGAIKFVDYSTRYRPELDLCLLNMSFEAKAGEKIGIVGRTGAGKSSLTLALFRMIEPTNGGIYIDGVDTQQLGLFCLRSRLTIIPQDPVLFSGTVRTNLDPFTKYTDEDIWKALDSASLKRRVESEAAKLDAEVLQNGENFSVGERQLMCLARALLRKTKILVLDEATAAIDTATDEIVQRTIRREFNDCTILTIAHRINTVMDADRILVLDRGQMREFDTPHRLLADKQSRFYGLAREAGQVR
ncbi:P-loop containing nucleoside triphosphate hydrolase protein [Cladochytrium replicatum]|nr:P-loop containing nucleoside triphosphate hydrolase protein [Cladochytrium replicatum]